MVAVKRHSRASLADLHALNPAARFIHLLLVNRGVALWCAIESSIHRFPQHLTLGEVQHMLVALQIIGRGKGRP